MNARTLTALVLAATAVTAGLAGPAAAESLTASNQSLLVPVNPATFKVPAGSIGPMRLTAARNGSFAGQVVVTSTAPIKGLKASASDLRGPGTIPAAAVTVRYALPDGAARKRGARFGTFDSLEMSPPDEVPVYGCKLAVQPLWVTAAVPADAAPGDYTGRLTVTAAGGASVAVPVTLTVIDWTLPDPNTFAGHMDIVQSPESVARAYNVEMWSDEHLAILDKTFTILRPLAAKTLYITAVRRTHFGNEHAMVRWVRQDDGTLKPNFDHVEKYLTVATKHLGKVPGVIVYAWEPISSMGHAGGTGGAGRTTDKPIQYTLWDPKRDKLRKRTGPAWGTPEAKDFWRRFNEGLIPVLRKHGLEQSLMYGLIGDARPTKTAMDDITTGVKDARWAVHSHHYCRTWQGYDVGFCIALWGIHLNIVDPSQGHGYGWQNPHWLAYYPREMALTTPLMHHRYKLEMWMGAFSKFEMQHKGTSRTARGLGRLGADFWVVLPDAKGNLRYTLAGRYPESYWGQLNLNYCIPRLLGKGRDGPLPTVRSEAFRESLQEIEARVFIEKAIVNKDTRAQVGEPLAKRCRTFLDERIRMVNNSGGARKDQRRGGKNFRLEPDGWRESGAHLFRLAAEVAKTLKK